MQTHARTFCYLQVGLPVGTTTIYTPVECSDVGFRKAMGLFDWHQPQVRDHLSVKSKEVRSLQQTGSHKAAAAYNKLGGAD